jgi:glycosyltransferase involved in cell wall biosynthesis
MKRVLIVSYFFPPISNMGSHRVLRFVRHLREFGWEPVVLTGQQAGWSATDEHLLQQVPADVEVVRVGSVDLTALWNKIRGRAGTRSGGAPSASQGLTTTLNRWVMIPDKYFPWIAPAARAARQIAADVVYSTSDPVSNHLVARRAGRPWVAEFRDLWLGSPYFARAHPTGLHRALHARMERRVAGSAAAIVGLSRGIADYFQRAYSKPVRVIYNCFDPSEYGAASVDSEFTVLYAGALYSSRSPEPFLAGFARFVKTHPARFVIVGGSTDLDLPAMIARHGLTAHVELVGRVEHAESLRWMQRASVLLAIQSPDDSIHVPGKLFEYIGARRPILAVSRPCEVAEMITEHQLGWVAEPDAESVAARLAEAYAERHRTIAAAERFSVRETTRQLAQQLEAVCAKS